MSPFVYPHASFDGIYHVKNIPCVHFFIPIKIRKKRKKKTINKNFCRFEFMRGCVVQIIQARVRVRLMFVNKKRNRACLSFL